MLPESHTPAQAVSKTCAEADPLAVQRLARRVVESLTLALQGSSVIQRAPSAVADAYVTARLSEDRFLE